MNDEQIYRLMARTPGIRAAQIADELGEELADVSNALKALVEVGDVVRSNGFTPEGNPAQVYNLSAEYRRERDGLALIPAMTGSGVRRLGQLTAPAARHSDLPAARTKVDRAIDCLVLLLTAGKAHASDTEIREAMGIDRKSSPRAYLMAAMIAGRIVKDELGWTLGESSKRQVLARSGVFATSRDKGAFECALRSDDSVELQRAGVTVMRLAPDEVVQLLRLISTTSSVE